MSAISARTSVGCMPLRYANRALCAQFDGDRAQQMDDLHLRSLLGHGGVASDYHLAHQVSR